MILVTGATGNVGGAVVRRLSAEGVPARALVHSSERADTLRGFDVGIVVGDYDDPASLEHALEGIDRVLLVSPGGPETVDQEQAVVRAVQAAAPGAHVVKLAAAGVDAPGEAPVRLLRAHQQVVQVLADSGLPTTVLAPNAFMQNLLGQAASVQEQGVLRSSVGDAAISHVDVRDVAAVAAHVLTSDGHEGATYTITGPAAVTYAQVAEVLGGVLGREVRSEELTPEQARAALTAGGASDWLADGLLELDEAYRAGAASVVTDEVEKATGRPARSVEAFLTEHRAAFG